MDPNKKEDISIYEQNAFKMYIVGFFFIPLSWLMCWIYSSKRQLESDYLKKLSSRSFWLFWISLFIFGTWTLYYYSNWTNLISIAFNIPIGEND